MKSFFIKQGLLLKRKSVNKPKCNKNNEKYCKNQENNSLRLLHNFFKDCFIVLLESITLAAPPSTRDG